METSWIKDVHQYIWHPCSQMKDYEILPPLMIARANGSEIELRNGKKVIDAISSWWCKSLGHRHPRLLRVVKEQLECFEHVIFANTTNAPIIHLSKKLVQLTHHLNKVFYAGDGSCAVEIAMKMSLHARQIVGDTKRTKFIALENSYHGETLAALSVSDLGIYRDPYQVALLDPYFITHIPYVTSTSDPLWQDCSLFWKNIEAQLSAWTETATAIIVEPILQGAGGMKIYSQDFLKRLKAWCAKHQVHLIADEIMTGIGRTGKMLACQHSQIEPDFLCLSKGLTSGWLPFSAVLTRDDIYHLFYDDYEKGKSFLHSHTYSGNVLGACLALEVLKIVDEESICEQAITLGHVMQQEMQVIAEETQQLKNVRSIGAMVAADLVCDDRVRRGFAVFKKALALGAFLRPLGNTIYWLPPLNTDVEIISRLAEITRQAIVAD